MQGGDRSGVGRREASDRMREKRKRLVSSGRGPTVLLVEDDEEMREMLAAALRRDGCRVIEAVDGDDAIDWLGVGILTGHAARLPALIVSDICLPYASGLEILEGVKLASHRIPVLLITGFGDEQTHAQARTLGAERVLDKPFGLREFRAAVADALGRQLLPPPWERDGHVL